MLLKTLRIVQNKGNLKFGKCALLREIAYIWHYGKKKPLDCISEGKGEEAVRENKRNNQSKLEKSNLFVLQYHLRAEKHLTNSIPHLFSKEALWTPTRE